MRHSVSFIITLFILLVCWSQANAQTSIDRRLYDDYAQAAGLNADELCLAMTVYHEARNQPQHGKIAVAHVVMNRAKIKRKSACEVAWRVKQFSWTLKNPLPFIEERRAWADAKGIAVKVYSGRYGDVTAGATHYHRHDISPKWSAAGYGKKRIGAHIFMKLRTGF